MNNISVIINYCSNEKAFLDACIEECAKFSNEIIVSYGSKLYSGVDEDYAHIRQKKAKYPFVKFVQYEVNPSIDLATQKGVVSRPHAYWHNLARWEGVKNLSKNVWTLFLDVDEIPDGNRFKYWSNTHQLDEFCCFKIANYWYFKKPINQAQTWEDTAVLIHSRHLNEDNIFGDRERDHAAYNSGTKLYRYVLGNDFTPLIHHYSWVRTPEQMLFKLKNWGHQTDFNNHDQMVAHIFRDDNVNDIVHNYSYISTSNKFNISL
jgi:hypothetical protein